jgi:glyoxylase-like metal-dependent hydrolase (beta-lactamase superfamily II)
MTQTLKPRPADPELDFLCDDTPPPGTMRELAPGVFWHRVPVDLALDHVNTYILDDGDGWFVMDAGMDTPQTRAAWESLLDGPMRGKPVKRILITHYHPDHIGAAGWLVARTGAQLVMTQTEYLLGQARIAGLYKGSMKEEAQFYATRGLPQLAIDGIMGRAPIYQETVGRLPASYVRIEPGDTLGIGGRHWQVLTGGGHSDKQAMLYTDEDNIFLAADQVMAGITPNIAVWYSEPEARPLDQFLTSLGDIRATLPDDARVLAGHKLPFMGLHRRIDVITAHHAKVCGKISDAARSPVTVGSMVPQLFRRELNPHHTGLAFVETLAHVNSMIADGRLHVLFDADGLMRIEAA